MATIGRIFIYTVKVYVFKFDYQVAKSNHWLAAQLEIRAPNWDEAEKVFRLAKDAFVKEKHGYRFRTKYTTHRTFRTKKKSEVSDW